MAITVISNFTSNRYYPSANPINCTINSNNSGKCNFRYVCDIYINGIKIFTDKLFPDPSTGYGFFQLSRILQDYIETTTLKTPPSTIISLASDATAPSSLITVYCRFGEEYDSSTACDGEVQQYLNLLQSNTFYVFESAIDYEEFPTFNYNNYLIGTQSSNNFFLTNSPRTVDISYNDSFYLDFISNVTITSAYKVRCIAYDYSNNPLVTVTQSATTLGSVKRYRIACGPYDINKITNDATITSFCKYYTIELLYNSTVVSEQFTFNVKAPSTFTTRFMFIGLLGGLESFTFYHRNKKSYDIVRKNYEKTLQRNYSGSWKYEVGDRGTTTYGVSAQQKNAVSTFCSREMSEWLYEMWLSPEVWTFKRPELRTFRVFKDGNPAIQNSTDKMLFWLDSTDGLLVGDQIFVFPDNKPENVDYADKFTITSIVSDNIIDCGLTLGVYSTTLALCGYLYKKEDWSVLPITISDNQIEVKQKTSRPIEYSLAYMTSYSKTTLRG